MTKDEEIELLKAEVEILKNQLRRCFKGETDKVRNELILDALHEQTGRLLAMPQEDLKEYIERMYS